MEQFLKALKEVDWVREFEEDVLVMGGVYDLPEVEAKQVWELWQRDYNDPERKEKLAPLIEAGLKKASKELEKLLEGFKSFDPVKNIRLGLLDPPDGAFGASSVSEFAELTIWGRKLARVIIVGLIAKLSEQKEIDPTIIPLLIMLSKDERLDCGKMGLLFI